MLCEFRQCNSVPYRGLALAYLLSGYFPFMSDNLLRNSLGLLLFYYLMIDICILNDVLCH